VGKARIVVVDDEQDNLDFLAEIIDDADCEAETHADGAGAVERMKQDPPALVFLDVQMPGMNGFEVLKAMRSTKSLASVPVVLLSAIGAVTGEDFDPDLVEKKYGVRPDAFVAKPIEHVKVTEQITAFVKA
jgi:CheY-like chemotaxis protein